MASKHEIGLFCTVLTSDKMMGQFHSFIKKKGSDDDLKNHPIQLWPVIQNMEAVMLFHSESGRMEARSMLERLHIEYPRDLNILADLIYVYTKVGRERDSRRFKKELKSLEDDSKLQARCMLAQAFVLSFVFTSGSEMTPDTLMKDIWRRLSMREDHPEEVKRVRTLLEDAYKVSKTTGMNMIDDIRIANEKYKKGIEMLKEMDCSREEMSVWKFHYALNWISRLYYYKLDQISKNYIIVLQIYLDVIENLTSIGNLQGPLTVYLVVSYIAFAKITASHTSLFNDVDLPEIIKGQDIQSMCLKAFSINQDASCLFHYAICLYSMKMYLKAIDIMNKYISLHPDTNIEPLPYILRGELCVLYCSEIRRKASDEGMSHNIHDYWKMAYEDMKRVLKSTNIDRRGKEIIASNIGVVCLERAMPHVSGIDFGCQNLDFIYEAIDILNEALSKWGITFSPLVHHHLGMCYMFAGEYRKGIESLKTALELGEWKEGPLIIFFSLCRGFMMLYTKENDEDSLNEFRLILKETEKRGCNELVTNSMTLMYYLSPENLIDLLKNMIDWDLRGCQKIIKESLRRLKIISIIQYLVVMREAAIPISHVHNSGLGTESEKYEYLNRLLRGLILFVHDKIFYLKIYKYIRVLYYLEEQFKSKLKEEYKEISDINDSTEIRKTQTREIFKYDFFVSHSEKDQDWVDGMLRPRLEEFDNEINFKGFIPSRDLIPGDLKIRSTLKGIKQSRKLLIVLTPSYLKDNWQKYISDQMIFSVIKTKMKEKTIIPIIIEPCEIPEELNPFPSISFTEKSDWKQLYNSLTKDVGSSIELQDEMSTLTLHDSEHESGSSDN